MEAQDGKPVEQGSALARAPGRERVFRDARPGNERLERGVSAEERLVAFRALLDVGLNEHLTSRREDARELVEQREIADLKKEKLLTKDRIVALRRSEPPPG